MTSAQWNRLQSSFPPEDRISYAEYLNAIGESAPTPLPTTAVTPAATKPDAVNMPYDSSTPATTTTMPYSGTTVPSVKNLDTTTLAGIEAASATTPTPTGKNNQILLEKCLTIIIQ